MKILSSEQIKWADQSTIENEPISSLDLMERAAKSCVEYIEKRFAKSLRILVICGNGNNGGDGLAIARLLNEKNFADISVFVTNGEKSKDCAANLKRLADFKIVKNLNLVDEMPDLIIDSLFGIGLTREVEGEFLETIQWINQSSAKVLSIDLPSGLKTEDNRQNKAAIVKSNLVLTFQCPKLALLLADNFEFAPNFVVLDIGLNKKFMDEISCSYFYVENIRLDLHKRKKAAYKHNYGFALVVAGSETMMGAAMLSSKACLVSGVGLLCINIPKEFANSAYAYLPEAMHDYRQDNVNLKHDYTAIAIGPGLEINEKSINLVKSFLQPNKPLVLDADALNIVAYQDLHYQIPQNSIITPHIGEFDRLFGKHSSAFDRLQTQIKKAIELKIYIILKGPHTSICTPEGECYFNSTGNPYMATSGSGDVLTGIIASLVAQGYSTKDACINSVYLHGLAGDIAHNKKGNILATDIIDSINSAIKYCSEKDKNQNKFSDSEDLN